MDRFYKKFSSFLVHHQIISENDNELYEYATKLVIRDIFNVLITVLIGIIMQKIWETLCFYAVFFMLRKISGGLHLKSKNLCMLLSIIICILSVVLADYLGKTNYFRVVNNILVIISTIIIIVFSPVENENKPLTNKQMKIYKIEVSILSLFFGFISLYLLKINSNYSFYISIALFDVGCLVLIPYIKQMIKRKSNKDVKYTIKGD